MRYKTWFQADLNSPCYIINTYRVYIKYHKYRNNLLRFTDVITDHPNQLLLQQCLFCPDYFFPTCKIDGKSLNLNWGIHFFQQRVEQKCFFLLTIRQYNKGWHFKSTLNWKWQCRWLGKNTDGFIHEKSSSFQPIFYGAQVLPLN